MPTYTDFYENTTLRERKTEGQYMTPDDLSNKLVREIPFFSGDKVLEPALGTGQLIKAVLSNNSNLPLVIDGWEKNKQVLEYVEPSVKVSTSISNVSSLIHALNVGKELYDVVLSNPPFYEFIPDAHIKSNYADVISGRTNIFSLFFKLSIDLTKPGGYVGFIVPPSMNNGNFFNALRAYIMKHCSITHLKTYPSNLFDEAQTSVQIIVLKKLYQGELATDDHMIKRNGITLFVEDKKQFNSYWSGAISLSNAGYEVRTGTVMWNNHKADFRTTLDSDCLPLIYSKDLKSLSDYDPTLYTDRRFLPKDIAPKSIDEPFVAVNRIVGSAQKSLRAKYYDAGYYAENHVNFVVPKTNSKPRFSVEEVTRLLNDVPSEYLSLLSGNTQISKTELENLIPLKAA